MTAPLVDPALAAWQAEDPASFLADGPQPLAPATTLHSRHDVERDIAVAVVVIAALMVRELHRRQPSDPTEAAELLSGTWQKHLPIWVRLSAPAIRQAYVLGRVDGSPETLFALASDHAADLGNYFSATSSEAVLEGLSRQLNQQWSMGMAWRRASAAYGLDKQQTRAYLATIPKAEQTSPEIIPSAMRALVDRMLLARATRIGHDQAYTAEQMGRTLLWMRAYVGGELPATALRRWNLGLSEEHCAICADLAGQMVPPDQPYVLTGGTEIWAPRAHPGCTCFQSLLGDGGRELAKAMDDDPYDRRADGRFAPTEQRTRTMVLDKPDPTLLAMVQRVQPAPASLLGRGEDGAPSLLGRGKTLTGRPSGSLLGQSSLVGGSLLTGSKPQTLTELTARTQAEQKQAQRTRTPLHIRIVLPVLAPPAPGEDPARAGHFVQGDDLADYYAEQWDGTIGFGNIIPFDDILDHYIKKAEENGLESDNEHIAAPYRDNAWGASFEQLDLYSDDEWQELVTAATPIWHQARETAADVVDELTDEELRDISGRAFHGEQRRPAEIRQMILDSIDGDEDLGPGIGDAFADYVTFVRPDYIEGASNRELSRLLGAAPDPDVVRSEAPWAVRIERFARGDVADSLTSTYLITNGTYLSAIGELSRGREVAPGHLNLRVITVESDEVGTKNPYTPGS